MSNFDKRKVIKPSYLCAPKKKVNFATMTKLQIGVILSAVAFFCVLYFGCDTKPKAHQQIEKQRALNPESTSISVLLKDAKSNMDAPQGATILGLETQLQNAATDSMKIEYQKLLAGKWFEFGHPEISGYYAQQIAENSENSETAWSIAGTTYTICVQRTKVDKVKSFCTQRAINAFESAISLNSSNVAHRTNLALLYTENPPENNPMQGILMLVDLNKKYPDDIGVLTNLGRLSLKTGQFDKAVQRLEKVLTLEPENVDATCMLASVYQELKQNEKATALQEKCAALTR